MVTTARNNALPLGDGLDSLLLLKKNSMYEFFHGSRFPGQGLSHERCFVFKMSTKGPASGVDLVSRMQRTSNGDLRNAWIQFDHTRRVLGWSTMACHVYDPRYFFAALISELKAPRFFCAQVNHAKLVVCNRWSCSIQELLTIATCEMKEEDTEAQVLF